MILRPLFPWYVEIIFGAMALTYLIICLAKKNMRKPNNFRRVGILIVMALILLRPSFIGGTTDVATNNTTIFFVVDATGSMNVKDSDNNDYRINSAKVDMKSIVNVFPGSRFAIVIQDVTSYTLMPASYDQKAIQTAIDTIKIKPNKWSSGSDLADLLHHAGMRVEKYIQRHPDDQVIVFIMSDGEDNKANTLSIARGLFNRVSYGIVIGYGSENGGPVEKVDEYSSSLYVNNLKDGSYKDIVSKINEDNLKMIANEYGFAYYHHDDGNRGFAKTLKLKIDEKVSVDENTKVSSYIDTYWIFAIILLGLISWELAACAQKVLSEQESKK